MPIISRNEVNRETQASCELFFSGSDLGYIYHVSAKLVADIKGEVFAIYLSTLPTKLYLSIFNLVGYEETFDTYLF